MMDELQVPSAPERRRSSFAHLDIRNLRHLWSMRKQSVSPNASSVLQGEVLPNMKNYQHRLSGSAEGGDRNRRLTLNELISDNQNIDIEDQRSKSVDSGPGKGQYKMGWIEGVFMTCLLNIWGVMLFLRLTWVIGEAGLLEGLGILTVSNMVTTITTLSMSAVSTNGQITAGGIYYLISRSLGPEFGGAIGLMFVLAQSMAVAMHLIGFCESLLDMLIEYIDGFDTILGAGRINDIRLVGMISLVGILGLAVVGMSWMTKVQTILLVILVAAQVDFIIGTFIPPSDEQKSKGFVGYSMKNYKENMFSQYTIDEKTGYLHTFFSVFAVYFPSCTGIVAGANLSGDLKDPAAAIPKGTLLAVGTTYGSYILYAILAAGCGIRYASGNVNEYLYSQGLLNETMQTELDITQTFDNCTNRACKFGLIPSQQMIELMAAWGPLIYAGCFAATLSSAIACMFGAPRVFQAVAKDKLYPGLHFFAKGHGVNNDPFRGYALIFGIATVCVLIGDLNQVSSILSNFYVAAYGLINFSVFHACITKSPGWRPTFKYYNKWLSLFGTLLCFAVMILMDYKTALATYVCLLILYIVIKSNKPDANWGSSNQSMSFVNALKSVQYLSKVEDHVKTYRPKIILFSGEPVDRPGLVAFANMITKKISLLQCVNIVGDDVSWESMSSNKARINKWLTGNKIKAFYTVIRNPKFSTAARNAMETMGLGKLSPNMMLIGFQDKWYSDLEGAKEYYNVLLAAFDLHLSVGIFRLKEGFDVTASGTREPLNGAIEEETSGGNLSEAISMDSGFSKSHTSLASTQTDKEPNFIEKIFNASKSFKIPESPNVTVVNDSPIAEKLSQFNGKEPIVGDTIDVYWLYDDGGLTLLIPFILQMRAKFAKCKLRVFCLANNLENIEEEVKNITSLLKKFRIDFHDVNLLSDAKNLPSKKTNDQFEELLQKALKGKKSEQNGLPITSSEMIKHREKTNFHLRTAEIVRENSAESSLIVMTLPLPKRTSLPPLLYMAWMDFISHDLPPFLFVRGNQVSVLTFYS